jgi:LysR family transcriptional regulator, transcriptional activator of nhaA
VQLICHEDRTENLAAALQTQGLDLALTNAPITPSGSGSMKVVNHLLGTSTISVFGTQDVAARLRKKFPKSLHESPMLLPMENSVLRRALDHWFAQNEITPRVFGEFQDSGLLKTFAVTGCGVFFAPSVIEKDIRNLYRLAVIGRIPELHEHFYAVSVERRFKNTAAARIIETARAKFFGNDEGAEER